MLRKAMFLTFLAGALALSAGFPLDSVKAVPPQNCELVCSCQNRTTATFTKVGATCSRAQDNAAAAAQAAAVCNSWETPCGPVTVYVTFNCFPHPVSGQIAASAFATYSCEVCHLECDPLDDPPLS